MRDEGSLQRQHRDKGHEFEGSRTTKERGVQLWLGDKLVEERVGVQIEPFGQHL